MKVIQTRLQKYSLHDFNVAEGAISPETHLKKNLYMEGYATMKFKPVLIQKLLWSDKFKGARMESFVIILFYYSLYLTNILDGKSFAAPVS